MAEASKADVATDAAAAARRVAAAQHGTRTAIAQADRCIGSTRSLVASNPAEKFPIVLQSD